jgi:L-amino acid N-acyltransferase YncA
MHKWWADDAPLRKIRIHADSFQTIVPMWAPGSIPSNPFMEIRRATETDFERMWPIFQAVVASGDTYVFAPDTPRQQAFAYWFGPDITTFVAGDGDRIVGMYKITANQRDLGAHVANASFMVDPASHGNGIGNALGRHCLREARCAGYRALQFNFVVSSNTAAVALWKRLGFAVVGTLPGAFRHHTFGYVDTYVMYRALDDCED